MLWKRVLIKPCHNRAAINFNFHPKKSTTKRNFSIKIENVWSGTKQEDIVSLPNKRLAPSCSSWLRIPEARSTEKLDDVLCSVAISPTSWPHRGGELSSKTVRLFVRDLEVLASDPDLSYRPTSSETEQSLLGCDVGHINCSAKWHGLGGTFQSRHEVLLGRSVPVGHGGGWHLPEEASS